MKVLGLVSLLLFVNNVNCAFYWIFKTPAPATAPTTTVEELNDDNDNIINNNKSDNDNNDNVIITPVVVEKEIILDESVDEYREQFEKELADHNRLLSAIKQVQYDETVVDEIDPMAVIDAEDSLTTRWSNYFNSHLDKFNRIMTKLGEVGYGHSQYSDSEQEDEREEENEDEGDDRFSLIGNGADSNKSQDTDEDLVVRYITGKSIEELKQEEDDDKDLGDDNNNEDKDLGDDKDNFDFIEKEEQL